jgi:hypothetical protein
MKRRVLLFLAALAIALLIVDLLAPSSILLRWFGKDVLPARPDRLVLFSIDPTQRTKELGI